MSTLPPSPFDLEATRNARRLLENRIAEAKRRGETLTLRNVARDMVPYLYAGEIAPESAERGILAGLRNYLGEGIPEHRLGEKVASWRLNYLQAFALALHEDPLALLRSSAAVDADEEVARGLSVLRAHLSARPSRDGLILRIARLFMRRDPEPIHDYLDGLLAAVESEDPQGVMRYALDHPRPPRKPAPGRKSG